MFLRYVKSSAFTHIGYCEETQKLHVRFKSGKVFEYDNVTPAQWVEANTAKSIGAYFCRVIKPGRTFREVKYDGEIKGDEPAAVFIDEAEYINAQAILSTNTTLSKNARVFVMNKETGEEIELKSGFGEIAPVTAKVSKNWDISGDVVFSEEAQKQLAEILSDEDHQRRKAFLEGNWLSNSDETLCERFIDRDRADKTWHGKPDDEQ